MADPGRILTKKKKFAVIIAPRARARAAKQMRPGRFCAIVCARERMLFLRGFRLTATFIEMPASDRFIPISMINKLRCMTRDLRISSRNEKLYLARLARRVRARLFYILYLFYGRVFVINASILRNNLWNVLYALSGRLVRVCAFSRANHLAGTKRRVTNKRRGCLTRSITDRRQVSTQRCMRLHIID